MPTRPLPPVSDTTPYRPWTTRTIGWELEFNRHATSGESISGRRINRALCAADTGYDVTGEGQSYHHSDGSTWDVKYDGSCGWEVSTPAVFLDAEGHSDALRRGVHALAALDPSVNESCGLHVWIDCSDFDADALRRLMALWCRYEPFFYGLQPRSRWSNTYAQALHRATWTDQNSRHWHTAREAIGSRTSDQLRRACRALDKYVSIKTADFFLHGRVEFRLGAGTLRYEDVRLWTMLLLTVVERAKQSARSDVPAISLAVNNDALLPYGMPNQRVFEMLGLAGNNAFHKAPRIAPEAREVREWVRARRERMAMTTLPAPARASAPRPAGAA
jgi:hypothetical protein